MKNIIIILALLVSVSSNAQYGKTWRFTTGVGNNMFPETNNDNVISSYSQNIHLDLQYGVWLDSTTQFRMGVSYSRFVGDRNEKMDEAQNVPFVSLAFIEPIFATRVICLDHSVSFFVLASPQIYSGPKWTFAVNAGGIIWSESWLLTSSMFFEGGIKPLFDPRPASMGYFTQNSWGSLIGLEARYNWKDRTSLVAEANTVPVSMYFDQFGVERSPRMNYHPLRYASLKLGLEYKLFNL